MARFTGVQRPWRFELHGPAEATTLMNLGHRLQPLRTRRISEAPNSAERKARQPTSAAKAPYRGNPIAPARSAAEGEHRSARTAGEAEDRSRSTRSVRGAGRSKTGGKRRRPAPPERARTAGRSPRTAEERRRRPKAGRTEHAAENTATTARSLEAPPHRSDRWRSRPIAPRGAEPEGRAPQPQHAQRPRCWPPALCACHSTGQHRRSERSAEGAKRPSTGESGGARRSRAGPSMLQRTQEPRSDRWRRRLTGQIAEGPDR